MLWYYSYYFGVRYVYSGYISSGLPEGLVRSLSDLLI